MNCNATVLYVDNTARNQGFVRTYTSLRDFHDFAWQVPLPSQHQHISSTRCSCDSQHRPHIWYNRGNVPFPHHQPYRPKHNAHIATHDLESLNHRLILPMDLYAAVFAKKCLMHLKSPTNTSINNHYSTRDTVMSCLLLLTPTMIPAVTLALIGCQTVQGVGRDITWAAGGGGAPTKR